MIDHPARPGPQAAGERIGYDIWGWISGPCLGMPEAAAEPVAAEHVREGDILLLDDGSQAEITDIRQGFCWLETGHEPGIALGWHAGSSSGLMFRRTADILHRVARGQASQR